MFLNMLLVSTVADCAILLLRAGRYRVAKWKALLLGLLTMLYGCAGAKLLFLLENPGSPILSTDGFSFFGSVFLELLLLPLTGWLFGIGAKKGLDFCAPCIPLTLGFMRIACYAIGCCHGKPIVLGSFLFVPPVQLMEHVAALLIFFYLLRRERQGKRQLYPTFMVLYGIERFFMEFLRVNRVVFAGLTEGHILALICFAIGILLCDRKKGRVRK